jgi:hypothetical protein
MVEPGEMFWLRNEMMVLIHQLVRSPTSASGADEALGPTAGRKILFAGFLGGKVALKLAQGLGKRGSGHSTTLPVGSC